MEEDPVDATLTMLDTLMLRLETVLEDKLEEER